MTRLRPCACRCADKRSDISSIANCNGGVSLDLSRGPDQPREIITVFEQRFFDIGAASTIFWCAPAQAPS